MLRREIIVLKVGYQVEGLVDKLEIELCAIGLGILLEGSKITSKDWMP